MGHEACQTRPLSKLCIYVDMFNPCEYVHMGFVPLQGQSASIFQLVRKFSFHEDNDGSNPSRGNRF